MRTLALSVTLLLGVVPATMSGQASQMRPPAMELTTTAFPDGGVIPPKYTQAGDQVSPALKWLNVPPGTESFVLHMRDPDVARNRGTEDQVHWLVWNIPGSATGLPEGARRARNCRTAAARSAPAAPSTAAPARRQRAMHHYTFEVYALDTKLDVPPGDDAWATRTAIWKAMEGHVLGKAVTSGCSGGRRGSRSSEFRVQSSKFKVQSSKCQVPGRRVPGAKCAC